MMEIRRDMKIRDVIFLGAGASAADGAPTQNRLFKDYFESRVHTDTTTNSLHSFFSDFFGIDTTALLFFIQMSFQLLKKFWVFLKLRQIGPKASETIH